MVIIHKCYYTQIVLKPMIPIIIPITYSINTKITYSIYMLLCLYIYIYMYYCTYPSLSQWSSHHLVWWPPSERAEEPRFILGLMLVEHQNLSASGGLNLSNWGMYSNTYIYINIKVYIYIYCMLFVYSIIYVYIYVYIYSIIYIYICSNNVFIYIYIYVVYGPFMNLASLCNAYHSAVWWSLSVALPV